MPDSPDSGVLYRDYSGLAAATPVASLWSYDSQSRGNDRRLVAVNADGIPEYWLDRSDPLLNTILPGTGVSIIINLGDVWSTGDSAASASPLPRLCVVGSVTRPAMLRVGRSVRAIGAAVPATLASTVLNVLPGDLVDRVVPLQDLWPPDEVDRLIATVSSSTTRDSLIGVRDTLLARLCAPVGVDPMWHRAPRLIQLHKGRVSIDDLSRDFGVSRQHFARRFGEATGMTPKLFARITRFHALVHALLSSDVSEWAGVSSDVGFYDQAHMINEFRSLAGASPIEFFRPHGSVDPAQIRVHGRPSEWLQRPER